MPWILWLVACEPHPTSGSTPSECGACHVTALEEWEGSAHAAAFSDARFQVAWAEERDPWCLSCHTAESGVSCESCHGSDGRRCVDCHEFDLPVWAGGPASGTLAQSTASEWKGSGARAAGLDCIDCHPPHRPRGGSDVARVREHVSAAVFADGPAVDSTVRTHDMGHAFPTGDPFRRLELTVCADLSCRHPLATHELSRRLERHPDGGWRVRSDTRVPAPEAGLEGVQTVRLFAPDARSWKLTYHLVDPRHRVELADQAGFVVATGLVETP